MSGCPTGRLSSRSASDRQRNHRRRTRKTGLAGIGQKLDQRNQPFPPVQSLPGLFSAVLSPFSMLIPPGFLLPSRIEMLISRPRKSNKAWECLSFLVVSETVSLLVSLPVSFSCHAEDNRCLDRICPVWDK